MFSSSSVECWSSQPNGIEVYEHDEVADEIVSPNGLVFSCFSKSSKSCCSFIADRALNRYNTELPVNKSHNNPIAIPTS
jgi:hypothetical protein